MFGSYQMTNYAPSLKTKAAAELELRRRQNVAAVPTTWQGRVKAMFPAYFWYDFSPPHVALWEHEDGIKRGETVRPFVALWPRGRGKSTNAEALVADLGATGRRVYCIYVCGTQDQADKHVATIQHMLESGNVTQYYPDVGGPRIGKHGSRTWRRSVMTAANGFTVEAIGLDKAVRGQKIDWARPDLIIFDDVDEKHDTENTVTRKKETITTSILPAGSPDCAVFFVQNLIHRGSIAHQLSIPPGQEGAADYLTDRIISGPFPAVAGLDYEMVQAGDEYRFRITAGKSLWAGFDLDICEAELNRFSPSAFELESQNDIDADDPNALLTTAILDATRVSSHPDLVQLVIGVDPSGGAGQCGIIGAGKARVGRAWHGYTVADYSTPLGTPSSEWAVAALRCYDALQADAIVVERNFGGDMVENTIRQAELRDAAGNLLLSGANVPIIEVQASRGKEVRAQPVAAVYQLGRAHHVGYFPALEKQWTQWIPGTKPSPDRLDAEVWALTYLGLIGGDIKLVTSPEKSPTWSVGSDTGPGMWNRY